MSSFLAFSASALFCFSKWCWNGYMLPWWLLQFLSRAQQVFMHHSSWHTYNSHLLCPLPNTGIDSLVLWEAWWIICRKKVLQEARQFWDKSNKMGKSTTSWTIYLSGTEISLFSLILYCSTLATSLVKAHSSPGFIETLIQFLKLSLSKDCVQ